MHKKPNNKAKSLIEAIKRRGVKKGVVEVVPVDIEKIARKRVKKSAVQKSVALAKVVSRTVENIGDDKFLKSESSLQTLIQGIGVSPKEAEKHFASYAFRNSLAQFLDATQIQKLRDKHMLGCEAKKVITLQVDARIDEKKLHSMAEKLHGEFIGLGGLWFGNRQAYFAVPDHLARVKYFDQVFKILGEYDDKKTPDTQPENKLKDLTLDQIRDIIREDFE